MSLPDWKIFHCFRGKPFRRVQREWCQRVYHYPHRNLLIIGQPKSGSTWLFNMMREVPGYLQWMPKYIEFEQHDLQESWATQTPAGYTVTKTHTRPTDGNLRMIHATRRPYVVLMRDLRDIAVSWCFYVANEANHPRHELIQPLAMPERLDYFIDEMLGEFVFWSTGWLRRHDESLGMIVRYEQLLADTPGMMRLVISHFGIDPEGISIARIVDRHRFEKTTGRRPGEEDATDFNRKGVAGDWVNHFADRHREAFKRTGGQALIELGYESTLDW